MGTNYPRLPESQIDSICDVVLSAIRIIYWICDQYKIPTGNITEFKFDPRKGVTPIGVLSTTCDKRGLQYIGTPIGAIAIPTIAEAASLLPPAIYRSSLGMVLIIPGVIEHLEGMSQSAPAHIIPPLYSITASPCEPDKEFPHVPDAGWQYNDRTGGGVAQYISDADSELLFGTCLDYIRHEQERS